MRHLKLVTSKKYELMAKIIDFAQRNASQTHKLIAIKNIFDYASINQQFIMIGDSGELDPEVRK
jgi:phosphatidate phosphatase APP1